MMKKQSTLFPEKEVTLIPEIGLEEAEKLASQIKASVENQCDKIEVAGS